jgi:hypothetical protein
MTKTTFANPAGIKKGFKPRKIGLTKKVSFPTLKRRRK